MSHPHSTARSSPLERLARLGPAALAFAFCLCGVSDRDYSVREARAQPPSAVARCQVIQKRPLFVAFANGMSLDSFEPATLASREIWRRVKNWLCDSDSAEAFGSESLRAAIARHSTLRVEQVRFDDAQFSRAHAVVVDARLGPNTLRGWHVYLQHGEESWRVTHASDVLITFASR